VLENFCRVLISLTRTLISLTFFVAVQQTSFEWSRLELMLEKVDVNVEMQANVLDSIKSSVFSKSCRDGDVFTTTMTNRFDMFTIGACRIEHRVLFSPRHCSAIELMGLSFVVIFKATPVIIALAGGFIIFDIIDIMLAIRWLIDPLERLVSHVLHKICKV